MRFISIFLVLSFFSVVRGTIFFEFPFERHHADSSLKISFPESLFVHAPVFDSSSTLKIDLSEIGYPPLLEKRFLFTDTLCFRFQFAFDSVQIFGKLKWVENRRVEGFDLVGLWVNENNDYSLETRVASVGLILRNGQWRVRFSTLSGDSISHFMGDVILPNTPCNIEMLIQKNGDLFTDATIFFRLNGSLVWSTSVEPWKKSSRTGVISAGYIYPRYNCKGVLYLDNFALSTGWSGSPPMRPIIDDSIASRSALFPTKIVLYSPVYRPFIQPSSHFASRYQVSFRDSSWELPLYDSGDDSSSCDSLVRKLTLERSVPYVWRIRHISREGSAGDWSDPKPLVWQPDKDTALLAGMPEVKEAFFTRPGESKPEWELVMGEWYDLFIRILSPTGWDDAAYAIFYATRQGVAEGGMHERGGRYLPAGNYVYNIQIDPLRVFTKHHEGKALSTEITGKEDVYVDARPGACVLDSVRSVIRARIRFPKQAKAGEWSLRGFVKNESEQSSPLYYARFRLLEEHPSKQDSRALRYLFFLFLPAVGIFLLVIRLRRRQVTPPLKPSREVEVYNRFLNFVREDLLREFKQEDFEKSFHMSYSNLFRIVKNVSGKSVKKIVLEEKIAHARELLSTTSKNVSEVMMEVGFTDASHFAQIFKKHTGKTPSEYSRRP